MGVPVPVRTCPRDPLRAFPFRRVGAVALDPLFDAPFDAEPRRVRFGPPLRSPAGELFRALIAVILQLRADKPGRQNATSTASAGPGRRTLSY
jgi:hypothetical protein